MVFLIGGFLGWFLKSKLVVKTYYDENKTINDLYNQLLKLQVLIQDSKGN